jgi:LysR family glycine cleavage system transcriptional activator
VALHLDADPRQVRFDGPVPDLAIRYGPPREDGLERVELYRPRLVICVRPDRLPGDPSEFQPPDLAHHPLLGHSHRGQWREWLAARDLAEATMRWGSVYSDDILLREAALAGQGVALAREPYVRDDLDRGALVQLFDAWLPEERYWLVGPARVFERSAPALFRDWLLTVLSDDDALG